MGNEAVEVTELLQQISAEINFRPEEGAFRSLLAEIALAGGDEDSAELFSASSADILVNITPKSVREGLIPFLVSSDQGEHSLTCSLADLNAAERSDFHGQLSRMVAAASTVAGQPQKVIVRKRTVTGMLDIHLAAQKLGCSESFLKSRIPCSDYSYDEVDGKPVITGYFWSEQLIDRLLQSKTSGVKAEDLEYVSQECCHGDGKWAEEILANLARPLTRPRPAGNPPNNGAKPQAKIVPRERHHHRSPRKKNP